MTVTIRKIIEIRRGPRDPDDDKRVDNRIDQAFEWDRRSVMHPNHIALWIEQNVGYVRIEFDDGRRVVREAAPIIGANLDWLRSHGHADIIQPDGTLWLDDAGEYRYRFLRPLVAPFAAYERA